MRKSSEGNQPKSDFQFAGFSSPQYTQVPDQLFDELLARLSGNEIKVVLYICRRTFGFKKDNDNISLNQMLNGIKRRDGTQLDFGVGLSKPTLMRVLSELKAKKIIIAKRRRNSEKGDVATNYRLNIRLQETPGQKMNQGEAQNLTTPPVSTVDHQQETELQQTEAAAKPTSVQSAATPTPQQALLSFGIDKPTVSRLVKNHSVDHVMQKVDYVVFMQESGKVSNPRGWLLKAIREDYGPPNGYRPKADREAEELLKKRRQATTEAADRARQEKAEAELQQRQAELLQLLTEARQQYNTTAEEEALWETVLSEIDRRESGFYTSMAHRLYLLTTSGGAVVLGAADSHVADWARRRLGDVIQSLLESSACVVDQIQIVTLKEAIS